MNQPTAPYNYLYLKKGILYSGAIFKDSKSSENFQIPEYFVLTLLPESKFTKIVNFRLSAHDHVPVAGLF